MSAVEPQQSLTATRAQARFRWMDQRSVAIMVLIGVAYYAGARLGFTLRFPPMTPSVMWPPNAILTTALLLTPPRRWWMCLLAALPAHLLVQMPMVRPEPLILALFLTNCSEALIAAAVVHYFSDAPDRFDTLRRVAIFIAGAVLLAPFASSFADAAAVATLRHEPYGMVWRTRFFSNVLTELTLVPALVMALTTGSEWIRKASLRRHGEAALLAIGLVAVGFVVFAAPHTAPNAIPGLPNSPLPFLLPFLLWGAVRFGPGGASLSLLGTALVAIWAGTRDLGPFAELTPADAVLALQIVLTVVGIPVLCLAGVIEERRRTQEALEERLGFEEMLSRLPGAFVQVPTEATDQSIDLWLQHLGKAMRLDCLALLRLSADEQSIEVSHVWTAPSVQAWPKGSLRADFPWTIVQLRREQAVMFAHPDELPGNAARDAVSSRRLGVRSNLIVPLVVGSRVLGGLSFVTVATERIWPDELVQRLRLVAEVFANALARREMEDELRASEIMKSAILASLTSSVAVLDRGGRIISVNECWRRFARQNGATDESRVGVGENYLDVCRRAAIGGTFHVHESLEGIEAVLSGARAGFTYEYECKGIPVERWFAMSVVPLHRPDGGAVVSHTEVTERKRAELEVKDIREELAHFSRVSTVGELAASLAHELNQPLAAILINAEIAQQHLAAVPPDLREVDSILRDIVADDQRAAEVIRRLRELLHKGDHQRMELDLAVLIRDVARLVNSDAVIRNTAVSLDFGPVPARVCGDRVQLQQVVLNLLLNAMEAMADRPGDDRRVIVRMESNGASVCVSVQDAGSGIQHEALQRIFQPFYTTKRTGMGMGLSIARSIVTAHGGDIWATNNPDRGATIHFTVPVIERQTA